MAQSYTRQSSFSDGDTITAALFNNEYDQLVNAFTYSSSSASTTGHRHDGTSGQGGNVPQIGDLDFLNKVVVDGTNNRVGFFVEVSSSAVEQIRVQDGAIVPVTDNDIDLGTSSLEFKDAYFDGTVTTDALVADTADINGGSVDGATLGTNSAITQAVIDNININGTTIGHTSDTDLLTLTSGVLTVAGEVDATSLDISGNADIDGTLEADAYTVDGTALNEYIADTVGAMVSGNTETNITVTYDDSDNTLDFNATGTISALNNATENELVTVGATTTELDAESGLTYNGSTLAVTGDIDLSGSIDVDGTMEADAITVDGTALNEYIADTVGAMVSSNTETNITVTYEDGDNTLDFVIGTLNQDTTGTADNITVSANNSTDETVYPIFVDGATGSQGAESDTGLTYNPSSGMLTTTGVTSTFTGNITGNVTGNASGTAATVTGAAQTNITSLGTLTALTVDNVVIDGAVIGHTGDTDLITLSSGVVTVAGEVDATSLDISGNADIDGTLEADAITVDGTALNEYIADTVGAMVGSNTETGITVTYEDGDNTLDFVIGTLNQDTTGTASKVTVTDSSANTNFPVVFHDEGTGNVLLDDTGALRYNPSSGELLVPNLTVAGTTTTVDTVTMNAQNAIIFEGATADANETTLSIVDPTGDHTQYLVNQGGYIPVLAAATTTQISATPEELNLLDGVSGLVQADFTKLAAVDATATELNIMDGGTSATSTTLADADRLVVNDNGTMKQVAMTDFDSDRFTITTSAPTSGSGKRTGHVWYVV
jgi:cytoskeletal protein CcmA (bactofilin family)